MGEAKAEQARDVDRQRYAARNAITIISARSQLLKKRLARGDTAEQVSVHFAAIDAAVEKLANALDGLDESRHGDPSA